MVRLPATRRGQFLLVLFALLVAIVGGVIAGRTLFQGHAAVLRTATLSDRNGTLQGRVHAGPPHGHPFVPFLGPFGIEKHKNWHQCGPAVRLMEGALKRKKFRHGPPRNCVGPSTKKQLQAFQRSIHYKPTGVYTLVTHQALVLRGGYTNEARRDLIYLAHKSVVTRIRHNVLVVTSHAALVGGSTLAYSQGGSRSYFPPWPRIPPATDCSGFVTWVLYQSGAGASVGYFGAGSPVGWTGSLVYQGHAIKPNAPLQPGDLVFFPSSSARGRPYGHVAVYIGHGKVESHGSVGVKILPYNYRPIGEIRRYIS